MGQLVGELWAPPGFNHSWELFDGEAAYKCPEGSRVHIFKADGVWMAKYDGRAPQKLGPTSDRDDRLVAEELERRARNSEIASEVNALCPMSDADVALVAHVKTLDRRLFRAKVALWSCGVLGLVELVHLLHH